MDHEIRTPAESVLLAFKFTFSLNQLKARQTVGDPHVLSWSLNTPISNTVPLNYVKAHQIGQIKLCLLIVVQFSKNHIIYSSVHCQ